MRAAWNRRLSDVAVLAFIGFVLTACNAPMPPRPEIAPRPGAGDYGPGSPFGPFVFRVGQGTATLKLDAPLRTPAGMGYFTLEINFHLWGATDLELTWAGDKGLPQPVTRVDGPCDPAEGEDQRADMLSLACGQTGREVRASYSAETDALLDDNEPIFRIT